MLRGARRQPEPELGATTRPPADVDPAAVGLDEAAHDVEPEAGAAPAGAVPEPVEDQRQVGVGHPLPLVGDRLFSFAFSPGVMKRHSCHNHTGSASTMPP